MDKLTYRELAGAGPECMVAGALLITGVYSLERVFSIPRLPISDSVSHLLFAIAILLAFGLAGWAFASLPPKKSGKELVTTGAYRYCRHPIYAAFLDFGVFGLALFLKSYTLFGAGILLHIICGRLVEKEEQFLTERFGDRYKKYMERTGKFIPRLFRK